MVIVNKLVPVAELKPTLSRHIGRVFAQNDLQLPHFTEIIITHVEEFLKAMIPNLWINIESPYVDKVYRDSYYHYYATKLVSFSKDCIRLSFFDAPVEESLFNNPSSDNRAVLQTSYLGFLVIRPTTQNSIGRNVLSPLAFKHENRTELRICHTSVPTTVKGVKLWATGFPHSAQDVETITCSQTTLWSVMEYFSHRYPEYRPILPSTIVQQLEGLLVERNLPAPGLSVEQVSFVLKENGFAPRIYLRDSYDDEPNKDSKDSIRKDFDLLLSCYVESGIPVIVAIEDNVRNGHAVVCIGYESTENSNYLDKSIDFKHLADNKKGVKFYDLDEQPRRFVFIDDNHPPYSSTDLGSPTGHYSANPPKKWRTSFDWETGHITAFVVPLYRKVYLDAFEAKEYVKRLLALNLLKLDKKLIKQVCLRLFLTSSRSYKDSLLNDPLLNDDIKQLIVQASLPKLIWIGELTNPSLLSENKVFGVIILDATEADTSDHNALIFAVTPNIIANFAAPNSHNQFLETKEMVAPFSRYMNNLNQSRLFRSNN